MLMEWNKLGRIRIKIAGIETVNEWIVVTNHADYP